MRPQQPVRDRNTSLWQSAVRETFRRRNEPADTQARIEHGVSLQALSSINNRDINELAEASFPNDPTAQAKALENANASNLAFTAAGAQADDVPSQVSVFGKLGDLVGLVVKYSDWDLIGWAQCGLRYVEYYIAAHSSPPYRYWDENNPRDINFGIIDFELPATSKVLVIGDWGTHMDDNVALMRHALKQFTPDAIIHLGDVYYSGTVAECTTNVLDVMDGLIKELNIKRPPFFTIPGNHDYYSGGAGFFMTIDQVNKSLPASCQQKASYFCLRTQDGNWQFLAMDTGLNDRNPVDQMAPALEKSEQIWHQDKLDNFAGTTILFSHHQLFSAHAPLKNGPKPYLNDALNGVFRNYYDRIAAWFWGHEHNLVIFKNDQLFGDTLGLKKGRLVGCSAYEEAQDTKPYAINSACTDVEYAPDMPVPLLKISDHKSPAQTFYNHAFMLLEIAPEKIVAKYYQYPSWDQDFRPDPEPSVENPIYTEDIPRIVRTAAGT
jgi:Calcineurin-like phosphoesterase